MASDDCRGKTKYPTLAEAQRGLELAQRTWRYPPARWYACDVCGGYHLTGKRAQAGNLDEQEAAFRENRERRATDKRSRSPFAGLDKLRPKNGESHA